MKKIFKNSIKSKLIFIISASAFIALTIVIVSSLLYDYYHTKQVFIKNTTVIAKVSAKNITAALTFLDKESITTILAPILENTNTKNIIIYNEQGHVFTILGDKKATKNNLSQNQATLNTISIKMDFNNINIIVPIFSKNERIGNIEIVRSTNSIKEKMLDRFIALVIISLTTFFLIIFLSFKLEKIFSKPILDLLDAMKKLQHYEKQITITSNTEDEFRELFIQFNLMVNEIYKRDKVLKEHNLNLESLVEDTNKKLEKASVLATTDVLTGLHNRRYIMDVFDMLIDKAQKVKEPLGVIMLDIDHFKLINDKLGHHAGDVVLKNVAEILCNNARGHDEVGRIGGEEFLILCKNSDTQRTLDIAQRIREKIATTVINYEEGKTTQVQISLGIYSSIPELSKEELLKTVDDALYVSKENGRNRVTIGEIKS